MPDKYTQLEEKSEITIRQDTSDNRLSSVLPYKGILFSRSTAITALRLEEPDESWENFVSSMCVTEEEGNNISNIDLLCRMEILKSKIMGVADGEEIEIEIENQKDIREFFEKESTILEALKELNRKKVESNNERSIKRHSALITPEETQLIHDFFIMQGIIPEGISFQPGAIKLLASNDGQEMVIDVSVELKTPEGTTFSDYDSNPWVVLEVAESNSVPEAKISFMTQPLGLNMDRVLSEVEKVKSNHSKIEFDMKAFISVFEPIIKRLLNKGN